MEAKDGSFGFDFAGEYTRVEPEHCLACTLGGGSGWSRSRRCVDAGVTVTVTFDSEPTHAEDQQRAGWQAILDNFARHVESRHGQAG